MQSTQRQKSVMTRLLPIVVLLLGSCARAPLGVQGPVDPVAMRHTSGWLPADLRVSVPGSQLRRDSAVEAGIRSQALRLADVRPVGVRVFLAQDDAPQPVYFQEGGVWWFSVQALKLVQFENEFAALIAAALALAESPAGEAVESGREMENPWKPVTRLMVRKLYQSGYDPRGVPSLWRRWGVVVRQGFRATPKQLAWSTLALELEEEAHAEIAKLPPLMNPVVRTPEFAKIEKRLQKL